MKKAILTILLCGIIILGITGCGNTDTKENSNKNDDVKSTQSTTTSTEVTKATTTTTTEIKTTKKDSRIKEGTYTSKFGKNNSATIKISYDGTATYDGNIDNSTSKKRKAAGTWSINSETYIEAGEKAKSTFIKFKWDDGTKEEFFLYSNSFFGDQWHEFKLKK